MSDALQPAQQFVVGPLGLHRRAPTLTHARIDWRAELRLWTGLAIASLAVAGVFALLLALSRVPGIERVMAWPLGFFAKGLVIHVVFSLVVWFLGVFALLVTMATSETVNETADTHLAVLGSLGGLSVATAFPLLFLPAFSNDAVASLNNYVPVIMHPAYYAGLLLMFVGIAGPAVRHLANVLPMLRNREARRSLSPLATAMSAGSAVYLTALVCLATALALSLNAGASLSTLFNEHLFWGGGHVLQFLNTLLMLTGWFLIARTALGNHVLDADLLRIAVGIIALFVLAAPLIYVVIPTFSPLQQDAFRRLQFVLGFPVMIIALNAVIAVNAARRQGALPWHDPAFIALLLSTLVFGVGGAMGLAISTSDTRTPAHYHAMITAVNLTCMALLLRIVLPRIGAPPRPSPWLRRQILLFGFGQLAACIGLFWAGGYGAPRKLAAGQVRLMDGAIWGMYLNGIGAVIAIIGGVIFVITVVRALRCSRQPST